MGCGGRQKFVAPFLEGVGGIMKLDGTIGSWRQCLAGLGSPQEHVILLVGSWCAVAF